jgi:hypothetical protein
MFSKECSIRHWLEHGMKAVLCAIVFIASLTLGLVYPRDMSRFIRKIKLRYNVLGKLEQKVQRANIHYAAHMHARRPAKLELRRGSYQDD